MVARALFLCMVAMCAIFANAWKMHPHALPYATFKVPLAVASAFFLLGGPLELATHPSLAPSSVSQMVAPAHADVRAAQKRTYFRYSPKLIEGGALLGKEATAAVEKGDWEAIRKIFEVYASKMNGSQKDQVDQTDTYVNSHFYRPMTILAGSFAERGTSEKQRSLIEQEKLLQEALDR